MYYWENRATLNDDTNPPAYILTIIKHKCLNYLQHLRTQKQTAENLMDIAQWELSTQIATLQACEPNELFTAEIQSIIAETLNSLPPRTQAIFRMHRYDRLTQKKIAETMHLSVKTIEFHINKAVQALRVALKDYIPAVLFFLHF